MESDEAETVSVDILHPENLSKEDLIELLSQRNIKLDYPHATKEDLLEIFHRTITPLPQRLPRANRRGRTIAQVHQKLQAKRRTKGDEGSNMSKVTLTLGFSKSNRNQQSQGLKTSSSSSSSSGISRLKPPPIVSSKQRTLKLSSSTRSLSSTKIQLVSSSNPAAQASKDNTSPAANSKVNFERKKIVLNKSPVQSKSDIESSAKVTSPNSAIRRDFMAKIKLGVEGGSSITPVADKMMKVSLKSPGSEVRSDAPKISLKRLSPMDINGKTAAGPSETKTMVVSQEGEQSPKKKIKRIAWP